ncbi:MAG: TolC family protein [Deltaproteobacteria bacterium]|nr:TolC family protein [Deltaproteobacteria bacterium]
MPALFFSTRSSRHFSSFAALALPAMLLAAQPAEAQLAGGADSLMGMKAGDDVKVLTLQEVLELGAENNFDLRMATEKVIQQETMVQKAWSALLPQVNASANYSFNCNFGRLDALASCDDQTLSFVDQDGLDQQALQYTTLSNVAEGTAEIVPDPELQGELRQNALDLDEIAEEIGNTKITETVISPAHQVSGNVSVAIPIFNGRALPLLQNAYTAVDATKLGTRQTRSAMSYAVSRAYYGAVTAKKFMGIAEKQAVNATSHMEATKVRVEMDTLAPLNLKRAQLEVIRAQQQVRAARSAYYSAVGTLGSLIGETTHFDVEDPGAPKAIENETTVEDAVSRALMGRDDLRIQKMSLTIADRAKMDAWMLFLPSVSLVASARMSSNVGGFVSSPISSTVMLQANLPIYDGGLRYASLREADSKIREQLLRVKQMEHKIEAQVRGNVDEIQLKKEGLVLSKEAVSLARESQAQATELYKLGLGTPLDVTDTNLAVFMAELDLARAELDIDQARLGLSYMLGDFPGALPDAHAITREEEESARQRMLDTPDEAPAAKAAPTKGTEGE